MIVRRNHLNERSCLKLEGQLGWLLITRRWVIARGFMARVYG